MVEDHVEWKSDVVLTVISDFPQTLKRAGRKKNMEIEMLRKQHPRMFRF